MTRAKYYVGFYTGPSGFRGCSWFGDTEAPTTETYGKLYGAIVGPFKTKRGAVYMSENMSTRDVETAERCARMRATLQRYPA